MMKPPINIKSKSIKVEPFFNVRSSHRTASTSQIIKESHHKKDVSVWGCATEYFESTSLHGLKYFTQANRPFYERLYWFVAIIAVYMMLSFAIYEQVERFIRSPVLTSFKSSQTPISKIPFPSITLCPETQIHTSVFNLTDALNDRKNLKEEERDKLFYSLNTCSIFGSQYELDENNTYSLNTIREMSQPVNGELGTAKIIHSVRWEMVPLPNPHIFFQPMHTYFGACMSFNMMPIDQILRYPPKSDENWSHKYYGGRTPTWSPDDGYKENDELRYNFTPPWHPTKHSFSTQVYIALMLSKKGVDNACHPGSYEIPSENHRVFYAEGGRSIFLEITPKTYTIESRLRSWGPAERGCYFQQERWLKYFKIYTQRNCELECSTNLTLTHCGCTSTFHPTISEKPLCATSKVFKCVEAVARMYINRQDIGNTFSDCNCLPSCSELQYDLDVITSTLHWVDHVMDVKYDNQSVYTMIDIRNIGRYIQGIDRSALFGLANLIANLGGVLGLFVGFSILSLMEMLYFFAVRNYTRIKRKNRENKTAEHILKQEIVSKQIIRNRWLNDII